LKTYIFKTVNETTVVIDGNLLRISRKGFNNLVSTGLSGEKTIDINNISGIQFKEPGVANGYIQFIVIGSQESKNGFTGALTDENTIVFRKSGLAMARGIKEHIEHAISNRDRGINAEQIAETEDITVTEEGTRLGCFSGCLLSVLIFIVLIIIILVVIF